MSVGVTFRDPEFIIPKFRYSISGFPTSKAVLVSAKNIPCNEYVFIHMYNNGHHAFITLLMAA